ncbi:hypothetical protein E6O75_ATG01571 [Venturia nashicola]|uniref:Uncharacterized protein n=1 Tax=Venturia nashicola TaxID=86259 RepID=A0A4Z1PCG7_9PEZI|nr:hypothetical protein E6O75_ATG01571 [Venturia nashicola]
MEHFDLAMLWEDLHNLEMYYLAIGESEFEGKEDLQHKARQDYSHSSEISDNSAIADVSQFFFGIISAKACAILANSYDGFEPGEQTWSLELVRADSMSLSTFELTRGVPELPHHR